MLTWVVLNHKTRVKESSGKAAGSVSLVAVQGTLQPLGAMSGQA